MTDKEYNTIMKNIYECTNRMNISDTIEIIEETINDHPEMIKYVKRKFKQDDVKNFLLQCL